jgi:general secretion pathway protein D
MKHRIVPALALALLIPVLAPAADPAPAAAPAAAKNYSSIEIGDLIAKVAKRTGKQFIVDPRVRAEVPLIGLNPDRVDYPGLLSILSVHMFAAYEAGGIVRVVPDAGARQLPIPVTTEIDPATPDDAWVTLLIQGKNSCAAHAVPVLRPMMPQAAHLAAAPQGNTLILVDHASNARRVADAFKRIDQATPPGQKCEGTPYPTKKDNKESK